MLIDSFGAAISDAAKKAKYEKEIGSKWMIATRYKALHERLDDVIANKEIALPKNVRETISAELPAGYELLRRTRNAAGHPEIPVAVESETVFMNLRMFAEYARRAHSLLDYLQRTPIDW